MPFSTDVPPEHTDPWFNPLHSAWAGLVSFINNLESALSGKVTQTDLSDGLATKVNTTTYTTGLAGKADLIGGKVPPSQMPPLTINQTHSASSQAAMLALPAATGDVVVRTDTGETFFLAGTPASTLGNWVLMATTSAAVASTTVAGISRFGTQAEVTAGVLTNVGVSPATLDARIDVLQAQIGTTVQVLQWTDGNLTTNGTSYGIYDTTFTLHEFRGARDPKVAGYNPQPKDRWVEPDLPPIVLEKIKIDDTLLTYTGTWGTGTDVGTYGSSDRFSTVVGAKAQFTWNSEAGGKASLIAKTAPHHGIATIRIDAVNVGTADLYSPTNAYGKIVFTSDLLTAGSHTIEILVSGTKNAASTGTVVEVDALELLGAESGTGGTNEEPDPEQPQPPLATGFLKRGTGADQQKLFIEGSSTPWRGTGVNLPWSQGCGSNLGLTPNLAQHTAMFAAAKPNSIYRYFLFGGANLNTFDAILNAARPYGHRFIPVLADRANGCGEPYCGPNPRAFYTGGWSGGWKTNHLTPVVLRYKNEPLIGWWEWVNEPHIDQDVRNFFDAVGAYVRNTLGDRHLIGTGTTSEYGNSAGMRNLNSSQYIDLCSQHEYDWNEAPSHWTTADRADAAFAGKPWYVGESGITRAQKSAGSVRAAQIQAKIAALRSDPTCCAFLYWTGAGPTGSWTGDTGRMEIPIAAGGPNPMNEINVINTEAF